MIDASYHQVVRGVDRKILLLFFFIKNNNNNNNNTTVIIIDPISHLPSPSRINQSKVHYGNINTGTVPGMNT